MYGLTKETQLKQRIEDAVGSPLTKTPNRFDTFDYECDDFHIELKSRQKTRHSRNGPVVVTPESYPTWMIPTCKVPRDDKPALYFYHWEFDDSLWYIQYTEEDAAKWERGIPAYHATDQEHFWIPREEFTRL